MVMDSFGDFMFLYFDDAIRIRSGEPIHDLISSLVARTHAISEKPDTSSRYSTSALAPTNVNLCSSISGDRLSDFSGI